MPAKDIYHDCVRKALEKDGWTITSDPFKLRWGIRELFVDLGANKLLAAERGEQKIAVEIKSFGSLSQVNDLENALGQYIVYLNILEEIENDRLLYLAIRKSTYQEIFSEPIGNLVIRKNSLRLLIFDTNREEIVQWIN
ncbi:MAG: XisH family protein [Oscillatoriaceae cyanobacterium Prado104]|jgi:hypothetical protein|nr:XisH family protein [Oscillatoriaceae cyanobacterium Prado104]